MDYSMNLVLGKPIKFYDICTIYQPTVEDIFNYGEDKYNELLIPYLLTKDFYNIEDESISNFDLLVSTIKNEDGKEIDVLSKFKESLIFFLKEEIWIGVGEDTKEIVFSINKDINRLITKDNYDEFVKIILDITHSKKLTKEQKPQSEASKRLHEKLKKGRERGKKKSKDTINLATIINTVKKGQETYITKEEVEKMTIWEIYDEYKTIMNKEAYKNNFDVFLVAGNKDNELDLEHWTSKMKINGET